MDQRPPDYLLSALTALRRGDAVSARREAETVLAARPSDPLIHHFLGIACCQLGDLPSGIGHLGAALAQQPANLLVRTMLARALDDSGDHGRLYEVVEDQFEPELVELRAKAARMLGRHTDEVVALQVLTTARPRDPLVLRALGHALALAGEAEKASEALDRALILDPSSIEIRVELGQLLCDLGQVQSGLSAFDDGLAITPNEQSLLLGRARALTMLRRFNEAELTYGKLFEIAPDNLDAIREYGLLLERTGRIDDVPALVERAKAAGLTADELGLLDAITAFRAKDHDRARTLAEAAIPIDPLRVYRLIAKIEESRGDLPAAFAAAELMNKSAPDYDRWQARGASARREIRRLADATTREWAAKFPVDLEGDRPAPAFIVGFPRSGTTLLDTFLMGHPDIVVLEEEPMLGAAQAIVGDVTRLPELNEGDIARARAAYFGSLDERIDRNDDHLVVDKMPFNMLGAALIHRLFPGASIIFAQRHPCDVVLSGFMQSFHLNEGMASFLDLANSADLYDAAMTLWTRSRTSLPLNVHDLVYERLVEDTQRELRPLIEFLGLEWRGELLDHQATAAKRGTIITPSYDQVTQPINNKAMGRWTKLQNEMVAVLPILLPWARRLGYTDDFAAG